MRPLAILGPTGSGKSHLALKAAIFTRGEVINCDSVQIYRGFDIGSAKPSLAERQAVTHHLFDIISWDEGFDAGVYAKLAKAIVLDLLAAAKLPIIVGGTGLYFRALCGKDFHADLPMDPTLRARLKLMSDERVRKLLLRLDVRRAQELHPNDRYRNERALELRLLRKEPMATTKRNAVTNDIDPLVVVIEPPRAVLRDRIRIRTEHMFQSGFCDEVALLLRSGVRKDAKPMQSIGYKEVVLYLQGQLTLEAAKEAVYTATCQYAKRQGTWFRKIPRALTLTSGDEWQELQHTISVGCLV